jgi:hypothetical protein
VRFYISVLSAQVSTRSVFPHATAGSKSYKSWDSASYKKPSPADLNDISKACLSQSPIDRHMLEEHLGRKQCWWPWPAVQYVTRHLALMNVERLQWFLRDHPHSLRVTDSYFFVLNTSHCMCVEGHVCRM